MREGDDVHPDVKSELERRQALWAGLIAHGTQALRPGLLNDLRIYRGQAGIYADKTATQHLTDDGTGVAVSILHSGVHYADDLDSDGLIYHYPDTDRAPAHDAGEIAALKNAAELRLPVFTVIKHGRSREVRLSWVESWDNESGMFLITHGEAPPPVLEEFPDAGPFDLEVRDDDSDAPRAMVKVRSGQGRFKFRVEARYGSACAVCDWDIENVLQAAHIWPKSENGSDEPVNGLPLCPNHHVALDAGLWAISPKLEIVTLKDGPTREALGIRRDSLLHLRNHPHPDAIKAAWRKWRARS